MGSERKQIKRLDPNASDEHIKKEVEEARKRAREEFIKKKMEKEKTKKPSTVTLPNKKPSEKADEIRNFLRTQNSLTLNKDQQKRYDELFKKHLERTGKSGAYEIERELAAGDKKKLEKVDLKYGRDPSMLGLKKMLEIEDDETLKKAEELRSIVQNKDGK